ncbi:unnamed protein product [Rotaria sp. Silwood2]|nr:unnamed protein product [Rotaria sp. Silwood2]CAF4336859.1 unnamed protein product [Rotaria sp. Silwood2]CAF4490661.1 unnamed protein product [Rotaria sp. Silwood2]
MSTRMIALERDIVAYFLSRREDFKPNVTNRVQPIMRFPVIITSKHEPVGSQSHFRKHRPTPPSFSSTYSRPPYIWTSNPVSSHVDDHHQHWVDCTCSEWNDCQHREDCPCSVYYINHQDYHDYHDDTEHEEHHHHDDHEHGEHEEHHHPGEHEHGEHEGYLTHSHHEHEGHHNYSHHEHGEHESDYADGVVYISPQTSQFGQDYTPAVEYISSDTNEFGQVHTPEVVYASPEAYEFDQEYTSGINNSHYYEGSEVQGDTTYFASPGSFY